MAEVIATVLCLYGLVLALALAPLYGLWRTRRMGQTPVRILSTIAIAVLGILLLVMVRQVYLPVSQDYSSNMGNEVWRFLIGLTFAGFVATVSVFVADRRRASAVGLFLGTVPVLAFNLATFVMDFFRGF